MLIEEVRGLRADQKRWVEFWGCEYQSTSANLWLLLDERLPA